MKACNCTLPYEQCCGAKASNSPHLIDNMPKYNPYEYVTHPIHYGGKDNPYEAIKVIEAWELGFNLRNTIKYISRAGKKDSIVQELEKALWYLKREIKNQKSYAEENTEDSRRGLEQ